MNTAKEFFDEFLDMRKCYTEIVYDGSSSRVYEADSDVSHQMNLHLYESESDGSNYFDMEIDVSVLKEDNSGKQIEHISVHILKDGNNKGKIYIGTCSWLGYSFITVYKIKKAIYDIGREYEIDSNFLDFVCDLIKIIQNYCLGISTQNK